MPQATFKFELGGAFICCRPPWILNLTRMGSRTEVASLTGKCTCCFHISARERGLSSSLSLSLSQKFPPQLYFTPTPQIHCSKFHQNSSLPRYYGRWSLISRPPPNSTSGRPNPTHESEIIHSATYLTAVLHTKCTQFHLLVSKAELLA